MTPKLKSRVSIRASHRSVKSTANIYRQCAYKIENETVSIIEKVIETAVNE